MGFIGTFSYYKTARCGRAILAFVYFIRDIFEVKSDDKEDFKSSWKHAVVEHRTLACVNLQCRVKPHRPLPFAFRWWIANVRDKQTFSTVSVSMTRHWPELLLLFMPNYSQNYHSSSRRAVIKQTVNNSRYISSIAQFYSPWCHDVSDQRDF